MESIQATSMSEAARILNIARKSLYRYIDQGKLTVERVDTGSGMIYNVYQSPSQPQAAFSSQGAPTEGGVAMVTEPAFNQPEEINEPTPDVPHLQLFDEWVSWKDEGVGTKTWSASHKKKCLRYTKRFFKTYNSVTYENLEKYLLETPIHQWALRRAKHSAVSSFAKFLYKKKRLMSRTEYYEIIGLYPKKPKDYKRDIKIITEEHLEPILKAIGVLYANDPYKVSMLRNLVVFLSETAVRISEAGSIVLNNLSFSDDPEESYVYLPEHITKNGKERYVPFSKKAQDAVREYLRVRPDDVAFDHVFLCHHRVWGYTTVKGTTIGHIFEDVSEQCNIPFTAHSFRHYRITKWANDPNISITDVQYWAGHETLMVTQGYIHVRGRQSIKAAFSKGAPKPAQQPTLEGKSKLENLVQLLGKMETLNISPEEQLNMLKLMVT